MILIETTETHRDAAREQAKNMKHFGSLTGGARDAHAALAEIVACELVGGEMIRDYDYDFKTRWGLKVDVKSKMTNHPPQPHFDVNILDYTDKQACDYLLFASVLRDGSKVWICGGYGKKEFLRDAEHIKAGETRNLNRLKFKQDNYNMQIKDLHQAEQVVKMLRGGGELKARPLRDILKTIHTIEELEGLANRRKWLNADLPLWTEEEIGLIKEKKWQLENMQGKNGKR